jgi:hypothetical protein
MTYTLCIHICSNNYSQERVFGALRQFNSRGVIFYIFAQSVGLFEELFQRACMMRVKLIFNYV